MTLRCQNPAVLRLQPPAAVWPMLTRAKTARSPALSQVLTQFAVGSWADHFSPGLRFLPCKTLPALCQAAWGSLTCWAQLTPPRPTSGKDLSGSFIFPHQRNWTSSKPLWLVDRSASTKHPRACLWKQPILRVALSDKGSRKENRERRTRPEACMPSEGTQLPPPDHRAQHHRPHCCPWEGQRDSSWTASVASPLCGLG